MSDPLISVLIPCYNRADTITRCLRPVLDGPYRALEVIVSDNGSTDGTAEAAAAAAAGDSRVRIIRHRQNMGPLPNWRACLEAASGSLVHWLWSDDWVDPSFYRVLVNGMERNRADMAICAARIVNESEGWSYITYSRPAIPHAAGDLLRDGLAGYNMPVSPAACLLPIASVRSNFHDAIPDASDIRCTARAIGCDALMILGALAESRTVHCHQEPLAFFSAHPGSISTQSGGNLLRTHYAWARLWWSRRRRLPRSWNKEDILALLKARKALALARGLA